MELARDGELKWTPKLSQLLTNQQQLDKNSNDNSTRPKQTSHLVQHIKSRTICFDMEIKFELKIRKKANHACVRSAWLGSKNTSHETKKSGGFHEDKLIKTHFGGDQCEKWACNVCICKWSTQTNRRNAHPREFSFDRKVNVLTSHLMWIMLLK